MIHPALRFVAEVNVEPHAAGGVVGVSIRPIDDDALVDLQNQLVASHAYLGRVRISGVERWCGSEWEVQSEDLINDLPQFTRILIPAGSVDVEIELRLELPGDRDSMTVDLRGRGTLAPPFPTSIRIDLAEVEAPLDGPPFAVPVVTDVPAAVAPPLPHAAVPFRTFTAGPRAVIPEVGILLLGPDDRVSLVTPAGVRDLPKFPQAPRDQRACTAGPGGMLALIWGESSGPTMSLFGPPDLTHIGDVPPPFGEWFIATDGCFDPTGTLLVLPVRYHLSAIDTRRLAFRWRVPCSAGIGTALDVTTSAAVAAGDGEWLELDPASGAERHRAWLPNVDGSGVAAGTAPRRFAWGQTLRIHAPLGAVAWHDVASGRGGQVLVPDALGDARLAVLDDGRIVAAGSGTWLVDPSAGTAARIAAGVPLPDRPLVTRGSNGYRLWTLDPQRWCLEIPG